MKKSYLVITMPVVFGLLGGCVSQSQFDAMQAKLMRQEQQIQQFNMQLSGVQPAQADTWQQVQSLRQEMGSLKGQIDDFNNATRNMGGLGGLARRVDQHHAALKTVETQFALDFKLEEVAPADSFGAAVPPGTPGTGGANVGGALPGGVTLPPANSTAPVVSSAPPVSQPQAQAQAPAKDTATALYDAGIKAFNERKYKDALKSFSDFTDTYPKNNLVSNAWFWRGECNFALSNFPAAALDYEQVISKYPSSGKAASSYLKQGMSFIRTNKKDAAKFRLEELIKKFPKAPEATRAKQVLKEI